MSEAQRIRVPVERVREVCERYLSRAGIAPSVATVICETHLDAELKGVGGQGIKHLPELAQLARRYANLRQMPPLLATVEGPLNIVDGRRFFGHWVARQAADVAITEAERYGAAVVGVRNTTDVFMLGHYAERIARRGMAALLFAQGRPRVHAPGGVQRVLGTNPISVAIPTPSDPFLYDTATSALSMNEVRSYAEVGRPLPAGVAIDNAGYPTRDASKALEGALSAFGGYKGFGLSLAIALLCDGLVGSSTADATQPSNESAPASKCLLLIALDPAAFGGANAVLTRVDGVMSQVRSSGKLRPIRIPGQHRLAAERLARERGLELDTAVYAHLEG